MLGLDRKALEGDSAKVSVSITGGHINRLVLDGPPSAPSLETLAAFGALNSMELTRAASSLDALPENCGLVELRMASNGVTDLAPLRLARATVDRRRAGRLVEDTSPLPKLKELYVDRIALSSLEGRQGARRWKCCW